MEKKETVQEVLELPFCDPIIKKELERVRLRVLKNDLDYVGIYDGEEGVGKSVLAMQHAVYLDHNFSLSNIVFTADDFIKIIKDPNTKKGTCIVLDEAFSAANSRASLTEVNRAMIGLATEMRQKNLFILIVIPSFFDLDRYFALWRSRALFHLYFTPEYERRYIVFDKRKKKDLYLHGKKRYDYSYPKSPFPPCTFYNQYTVNEKDYREKKSLAFQKRTVSNMARNWLEQRNALIKFVVRYFNVNGEEINKVLASFNVTPMTHQAISLIMKGIEDEGIEGETNIVAKAVFERVKAKYAKEKAFLDAIQQPI